jgi:hypothetical protein
MANSFYYAANSYLDEWLREDSKFHSVLAFENGCETSAEAGTKCLVEVSKSYSVARTLKDIGEDYRLKAAYDALQKTEPPDDGDVVMKVESFARILGEIYGKVPLSAASKFLWMRFRSPIIIFDRVVSGWLNNCGYKYDGYSNYHKIWSSKYQEFESQIRRACDELKCIKKFTLADQEPDEIIAEWTSSRWFTERVFDHFMLIDPIRNRQSGS